MTLYDIKVREPITCILAMQQISTVDIAKLNNHTMDYAPSMIPLYD